MVHGDYFVAVGDPKYLADTEAALRKKYKLKTETQGSGFEDAKEVRILNKVVRMIEAGVELEADPRHAELIVRELGVASSKPSRVPGVKAVNSDGKAAKSSTTKDVSFMEGHESEGEQVTETDMDGWTCAGEGGVWRRQKIKIEVHSSRRAEPPTDPSDHRCCQESAGREEG